MIQINLIPDIKQEYLRARRTRNVAISLSILIGMISVGIVITLGAVIGGQAVYESTIDSGIKDEYAKLQAVPSINEAVTLQNQLSTISSLNQEKTINSRLFDILRAINPKGADAVRFTTVQIDPEEATLRLEGIATNGYPSVEKLVKTIRNTSLEHGEGDDKQTEPLVSSIETGESSFGEDGAGKRVLRFQIAITYADQLFSNSIQEVRIISPEGAIDVTDSRMGVPETLFGDPVKDIEEGDDGREE